MHHYKRILISISMILLLAALSFVAMAQDEGEMTDPIDQLLILTVQDDEVDYLEVPFMTMEEAEEEGYTALTECVPSMGFHLAMLTEMGPANPVLMFDSAGDNVGIEFLSFVEEQPGPLWVWFQESEEVGFWTLHIFWDRELESICER